MYISINNKNYDVVECKDFLNRLQGLMFKKNKINKIIYFPKCNGIHTFFMFQNIDVCMTDRNYDIVYLNQNVKPWKIIIYKQACHTFELPLFLSNDLKIGQKLDIKKKHI